MSEVWFYHLTQTSLENALPQLLAKALERGWRVLVRAGSPERIEHLDRSLWTQDQADFLPHGLAGGPHDARQPILLTTAAGNPNGAQVLVLLDGAGADAATVAAFERTLVVFDGGDPDAVDAARAFWKVVTGAGHDARYWAQDGGGWVKKR